MRPFTMRRDGLGVRVSGFGLHDHEQSKLNKPEQAFFECCFVFVSSVVSLTIALQTGTTASTTSLFSILNLSSIIGSIECFCLHALVTPVTIAIGTSLEGFRNVFVR